MTDNLNKGDDMDVFDEKYPYSAVVADAVRRECEAGLNDTSIVFAKDGEVVDVCDSNGERLDSDDAFEKLSAAGWLPVAAVGFDFVHLGKSGGFIEIFRRRIILLPSAYEMGFDVLSAVERLGIKPYNGIAVETVNPNDHRKE